MKKLNREQFLAQFPDKLDLTPLQIEKLNPAYEEHSKYYKVNVFQWLNKIVVQKDDGKFYVKWDR